jgi:two-component system, NarL family, invasion response regulator UvrY
MTRVLLIDDHPIVLQGCRRLLQDADVCDVIEATGVESGYRLYRSSQPDVVIIDLALQGQGLGGLGLGGLQLIRQLRAHNKRIPILVFSMHGDPIVVGRALEEGATGYLLKDTAPEDFLEAFEAVRRGTPYLSHALAVQMAMLGSRRQGQRAANLTPRELQTLALVAEGKTYEQIADDLGVSYKTVANTCSQLKSKLGAHNLPELIRMAIEYFSSSSGRASAIEEH